MVRFGRRRGRQLELPVGSPDGRHVAVVQAGSISVPHGTVTELLAASSDCGGNSFYPHGAFTADGGFLTIRDDYELPQQVMLGDEVLASIAHPGTDFPRSAAGSTAARSGRSRNQWAMWLSWAPLLVSRGNAVLNPNCRGSSGRGQAFAEHVYGDPAVTDFLSRVVGWFERHMPS
ncbi:hypothetical protein [Kutzneria sp. 744]|uniref:hypothetical protein n=1 Tax=Kutzneria sp. (strain 744) TaxID=345341 RepID=UPI0004B9E6FC|nr:hypothetical protein [Kutzneria sp. 744]